jgi:hypothetical protein
MKKQTTWKDDMDKLMKQSLKNWDKPYVVKKSKGLNASISLTAKPKKVTA